MKQGTGLPVFPGVAIGRAAVFCKSCRISADASGDPAAELARFAGARDEARQQLTQLCEQTRLRLGESHAAIVEVQLLMLDDPDYVGEVSAAIASGLSAAEAALRCGEALAQSFAALDDSYMKARAADIRDMSQRVCDILCGGAGFQAPEGPFLLVADDLAPSETLQLPRDRILGVVTRQGSASSHTAILARTLNIPFLVQADLAEADAAACSVLAVDGFNGAWYLDPDRQTLDRLERKQARAAADRAELEAYRGRPSVTKTGRQIRLCANIGAPADTAAALAGDAEGVGLMRSEFLYLGRTELPSEEELFTAYRSVARAMGDRPVVIRTVDIGADKQLDCLGLEAEENPALGLRGLRVCLTRPEEIFFPQLRAVYRAAAEGNLSLMFPMVASLWELRQAKALCARVRAQLAAEGIPTREIPIGIMVETPAAAVLARELAREAAFFSVGTNDLTQYTVAADRQNARLSPFYNPRHPAVLALLGHIAACAREAGIPAGICGELAADPNLTETFLRMGFTQLSMAPGSILEVRKAVCESEE